MYVFSFACTFLQLPETDPAHRLAKFPSLSLRVPPKRWTPKSKSQIPGVRAVSTESAISLYSSKTSSAQASSIIEVSTQEPHAQTVAEVPVTMPTSSTTDVNNITPETLSSVPVIETTSPKSELIVTTMNARDIIYSSTISTSTPRVEVSSPSSVYTRARNMIFSSTPETLTQTLSIEAIFPKNILSSRNLILENDILPSSTTQNSNKVSLADTYDKYFTTPSSIFSTTTSNAVTNPKINIKPEMISSSSTIGTSERTLTTRQATKQFYASTEYTVTRKATTPRSTTVQYTSSYSKVASIGLNPATTPIPSVVLASSAPDIATPPPRFAMRIPIAPIGTKSSTPTPQTTTVRYSTYRTATTPIPVTTTLKPVSSTIHTTTSTLKPLTTTSVRPTTTTTHPPNIKSTIKPTTSSTSKTTTSTTVKPITTTKPITATTSTTTLKPITPKTTLKPITSTTHKTVTSTTTRLTTPKPTTTSVKPTTSSTTSTTTTQVPKHVALPDPVSITNRSAPNKTEAVIKDNEISHFSLAAPPPARDLAARGLQFTVCCICLLSVASREIFF